MSNYIHSLNSTQNFAARSINNSRGGAFISSQAAPPKESGVSTGQLSSLVRARNEVVIASREGSGSAEAESLSDATSKLILEVKKAIPETDEAISKLFGVEKSRIRWWSKRGVRGDIYVNQLILIADCIISKDNQGAEIPVNSDYGSLIDNISRGTYPRESALSLIGS